MFQGNVTSWHDGSLNSSIAREYEIHVQREIEKRRQQLDMQKEQSVSITAETLDATTSTFTTPEGSVTIGSVDTDRHGHQVSLRVKDNEGNEVALFFTPELADRLYAVLMNRSAEVNSARRR